MSYAVEFTAAAEKQLNRLQPNLQKRLLRHIVALEKDPRPRRAVKLEGLESTYRLRVGDYRIIYRLFDDRLVVLILKMAHRREVYRRL